MYEDLHANMNIPTRVQTPLFILNNLGVKLNYPVHNFIYILTNFYHVRITLFIFA
jgi:hypothetical protein